MRNAWLPFVFALSLTPACDGGTVADAGSDTPAADAPLAVDAPLAEDAPVDAPALDTPPAFDAGNDAGSDAGSDAGAANPCVAAGGTCAPVVPDACSGGIIGEATRYACGGGLGTLCCLPVSTPPFCDLVGTDMEGWVRPDGRRICDASCAGATLSCLNPGTRSEGWYSDPTTGGCVTPVVEGLVEWMDCTP